MLSKVDTEVYGIQLKYFGQYINFYRFMIVFFWTFNFYQAVVSSFQSTIIAPKILNWVASTQRLFQPIKTFYMRGLRFKELLPNKTHCAPWSLFILKGGTMFNHSETNTVWISRFGSLTQLERDKMHDNKHWYSDQNHVYNNN